MAFLVHPEPGFVRWRLHLRSPPEKVYEILATDSGRARFWAREAVERDGTIHWKFSDSLAGPMKVLDKQSPTRFVCEYLDDTTARFDLAPDGTGGTDLTVTNDRVPDRSVEEVTAGWISVLMNLKAVADFDVDLRTHDASRSWEGGFVENQ